VWAFVLQVLSFQVVGTITLWCKESWRPQWKFSNRALVDLSAFSTRITIVRLLDLAETRVVELVTGHALGLVALGNYALAARAQQAALQLLAAPLWESSSSLFSREQADPAMLKQVLQQRSLLAATLIVPAFLFIAASAPALLPAVFGTQWVHAVVPFQLLCGVCALRAVMALHAALLQGVGDGEASVTVAAWRCVLSLGFIPVFLSHGVVGVAAALLLGQVLSLPFMVRAIRRRTGLSVREQLAPVAMPWLVSSIAAGVGAWVVLALLKASAHLWLATVLSFAASGTVFLVLMVLCLPHLLSPHAQRVPGRAGQGLRALLRWRE
jgi:O-antigen/teichoic acid export membrane protein